MPQNDKLSSASAVIPNRTVTVYEALFRRRLSCDVEDISVAKEVVERLLSAAVWAPGHRLTNPWRFFVVEKSSAIRKTLGGMAYEASTERNNNPDWAEATRKAHFRPAYPHLPLHSTRGQRQRYHREPCFCALRCSEHIPGWGCRNLDADAE